MDYMERVEAVLSAAASAHPRAGGMILLREVEGVLAGEADATAVAADVIRELQFLGLSVLEPHHLTRPRPSFHLTALGERAARTSIAAALDLPVGCRSLSAPARAFLKALNEHYSGLLRDGNRVRCAVDPEVVAGGLGRHSTRDSLRVLLLPLARMRYISLLDDHDPLIGITPCYPSFWCARASA